MFSSYKDTRLFYSPVTFNCTQEYVLMTFHSHRLTNRQTLDHSHRHKLSIKLNYK